MNPATAALGGAYGHFSKRSGLREEDKRAKAHVKQHWGTIEKLADQISGGSYSTNKARASARKEKPQASGLIFVDQARARVRRCARALSAHQRERAGCSG